MCKLFDFNDLEALGAFPETVVWPHCPELVPQKGKFFSSEPGNANFEQEDMVRKFSVERRPQFCNGQVHEIGHDSIGSDL